MKHLLTFTFLLLISSFSIADIASELEAIGQSFSNNLATSDPSVIAGKNRIGVSGGAIRKRVSHSNTPLVTITPPSVSGGCGGIDINLGGFSFITGDEIRNMLKAIAQGTVSQAFMIAFTQGCPVCAGVLKDIEKWSQWAAKWSVDTCAASEWLVEQAQDQTATSQVCSSRSTDKGQDDDLIQAKSPSGECADSSKKGLLDAMDKWNKCEEESTAEKKQQCKDELKKYAEQVGVSTKLLLQSMGIVPDLDSDWDEFTEMQTEMYIALLGTFNNGAWLPPSLSGQQLMNLFLCGTDAISTTEKNERVKTICADFVGTEIERIQIPECFEAQSRCDSLDFYTLKEWVTTNKALDGFPFAAPGLLRSLQTTIEGIQTKIQAGNGSFTPFELHILTIAPFPLYKLLNLSLFYPDVVDGVLEGNYEYLAMNIASGYAEGIFSDLSANKRGGSGGGNEVIKSVSKSLFDTVVQTRKDIKFTSNAYVEEGLQWENMNRQIAKSILDLERILLKANMGNGIGGLAL